MVIIDRNLYNQNESWFVNGGFVYKRRHQVAAGVNGRVHCMLFDIIQTWRLQIDYFISTKICMGQMYKI